MTIAFWHPTGPRRRRCAPIAVLVAATATSIQDYAAPATPIRWWMATVIAAPSSFDPSRTLGRRRGADPLTGSTFAATAAVAGARKRSRKERGYDRRPRFQEGRAQAQR